MPLSPENAFSRQGSPNSSERQRTQAAADSTGDHHREAWALWHPWHSRFSTWSERPHAHAQRRPHGTTGGDHALACRACRLGHSGAVAAQGIYFRLDTRLSYHRLFQAQLLARQDLRQDESGAARRLVGMGSAQRCEASGICRRSGYVHHHVNRVLPPLHSRWSSTTVAARMAVARRRFWHATPLFVHVARSPAHRG